MSRAGPRPQRAPRVALVRAGKLPALDVSPVVLERHEHLAAELRVAPHEARVEAVVEPEHVVGDEDLAVTSDAGADADDRDGDRLRDLRRERGRHLLDHDGERARLLERERVSPQLLGLGLLRGAHLVGAELVDRLRRQAEVPHHGDAHVDDATHRLAQLLAALDLDRLDAALLDHAARVAQRLVGVHLVAHEGHVSHHEGALHAAAHDLAVVEHLLQRHADGRVEPLHHHAGRVPDEDHVDPRLVEQLRRQEVVSRQRADRLALLLHRAQGARGHLAQALLVLGVGRHRARSLAGEPLNRPRRPFAPRRGPSSHRRARSS